MNTARIFTGPGTKLLIPMDPIMTYNPKCKQKENMRGDKKGVCRCLPNIFEVPWGYWYRIEPHPEIVRQATHEEVLKHS